MDFPRKFLWVLSLCLLCACSSAESWKTYSSDEFGVSLDSPYPVQFTQSLTPLKTGSTARNLHGHAENPTPRGLDIVLFTLRTLVEKKMALDVFKLDVYSKRRPGGYDSKALLDNMIGNLNRVRLSKNDIKDFQYKNQPAQCSGMPATLTSGNFQVTTNKLTLYVQFQNLLVVHKDQYWQVFCTFQDNDRYSAAVQRIFQSVKIKTP